MEELNLDPYLIRWLKEYLTDRQQVVIVDGELSGRLPVIFGVPQGSVLGPLLFIVYINNIVMLPSGGSETNLFADDIALYHIITSPSDYVALQEDICTISSFLDHKHLSLNEDKCRTMLISGKRSNSIPPPTLYLNAKVLQQVSSYKYLGVIITNTLSWKPHIKAICKNTRKLIGMLYRNFYEYSSSDTLLKLYLTNIRPHLEYASPVWDPFHKGEIDRLEGVQKFALRMCSKSWSLNYETTLAKT